MTIVDIGKEIEALSEDEIKALLSYVRDIDKNVLQNFIKNLIDN